MTSAKTLLFSQAIVPIPFQGIDFPGALLW
jgi:hypothetical protein